MLANRTHARTGTAMILAGLGVFVGLGFVASPLTANESSPTVVTGSVAGAPPAYRVKAIVDGDVVSAAPASDSAGSGFRLELPRSPRDTKWVAVRVTAGSSGAFRLVDTAAADTDSNEVDLGSIPLRGTGSIAVTLRGRGRKEARVWLLAPDANAVLALAAPDSTGRVIFTDCPRGNYRVVAFHPEHGRGEVYVRARQGREAEADLAISRRDVELRLIDANSGAPLPDVAVQAVRRSSYSHALAELPFFPPLSIPPTDAQGKTRLIGISEDDRVVIRVRSFGYRAATPLRHSMFPAAAATIAPEELAATIELVSGGGVLWPIVANEHAPPVGTTVRLLPDPRARSAAPPAEGRVTTAGLEVVGFAPGVRRAIAVTESGARARLVVGVERTEGGPIAFEPGSTITVRVVEADGTPAADVALLPRLAGNGRRGVRPAEVVATRTDAEGIARLGPFFFVDALDIFRLDDPRYAHWGTPIAELTALDGDRTVEHRLPPSRKIELVVTSEDGTRPEEIWVASEGVLAHRIERDGDRAVAWLRSSEGTQCVVFARGFVAQWISIESDAPREIRLSRGATVRVEVELPEDRRGAVLLEEWVDGEWRRARLTGGGPIQPPRHPLIRSPILFECVPPGRYRLIEPVRGATSDPFEVGAGTKVIAVPLELEAGSD